MASEWKALTGTRVETRVGRKQVFPVCAEFHRLARRLVIDLC